MLRLRATNPKERFPDPGDEEHRLAVRKRLQAAVWEEEIGQRQRVINLGPSQQNMQYLFLTFDSSHTLATDCADVLKGTSANIWSLGLWASVSFSYQGPQGGTRF
ncbi:hypothetical protein PGTUg99_027463 [Puccinia graminis f. sp. tritici]|uniref:Uncharacterized protein n=1 Tax=Puccinia graminis f. sp. tritici TaxID=56615 RepID=A0A5B0NM78_PUCGR|nr:hypothetical protein PGTUg99_027463 [Puccinia graminis f. sp. tritici]